MAALTSFVKKTGQAMRRARFKPLWGNFVLFPERSQQTMTFLDAF